MKTTNFLLILLGSCLILCFFLMLMNNDKNTRSNNIEGFDPVIDAITSQLQNETPEQLKGTVNALQKRLIDYGYAPALDSYVKKTELGPNSDKCLVSNAQDRDKYISKSDIELPGPRIDLSQYVKKSSIPPQTVCPPQKEIDYSAYVKKSTLPPNDTCPPCISPKVKVSAGLCRECPPAPSCPPPERCPEVKCPAPIPCPEVKCAKCDEVRYIKVPAVITKTITLDSNGNVVSQKIDSGNTNPTAQASCAPITTKGSVIPQTTQASVISTTTTTKKSGNPSSSSTTTTQENTMPTTTQETIMPTTQQYIMPTTTQQYIMPTTTKPNFLNNIFDSLKNNIPTTTFPVMSTSMPNITLAQSLAQVYGSNKALCPSAELNSEFKSYGIYGL